MTWSFYDYDPTLAGAVIALIVYGGSTGFHGFQLWKLKCYFFTTFVLGAISEFEDYFVLLQPVQHSPVFE